MAELPYFPFYPKDFIGDRKVATMTLAARGLYITLLSYAWHEDPPGSVPKSLVSYLGVSLDQLERDSVLSCFYEAGDRLFQKRMVIEAAKLSAKKRAQSEGGRRAMARRYASPKIPLSNLQLSSNISESESESESEHDRTNECKGNNGELGSKGRDPNKYTPPPKRSDFIDRRNPPFRHSGLFVRPDVQAAIKDLLKYQEETHDLRHTGISFNSLLNRFEHVKSAKEICAIIDRCISSHHKNPVFPDQGTFR